MSRVRTVAALFHERERRAREIGYKLWKLADVWRARGIELVVAYGTEAPPEADVWINHLDLTRVPERYATFLASQPVVVNRCVSDISKRAISANLVAPDDGYEGPVIVKSDLNHGGIPERRAFENSAHADDPRQPRRLRLRGPAILRTLERKGRVSPGAYPVHASALDVDPEVFACPSLVVERFLPERDGDLYCGRCYLFFGGRELWLCKWATAPVIRAGNVVRMEPCEPSPELVAVRERLGFDYGKFDYVVRDGRAVLFDASRTPTFAWTDAPLTAFDRAMVETLAGGLDAFLDRAV